MWVTLLQRFIHSMKHWLRIFAWNHCKTRKCIKRIDDTGKPYYVNDYAESHKVDTQYKIFYTLSVYCGFRKGETLAIHWDDISFEKKEISISKSVGKAETGVEYKKPKTKTSIRTVTFPEQIIPLLKQYRTEYNLLRLRLGSAWKGDGNLFIRDDGQLMGRSTPYQFFKRNMVSEEENNTEETESSTVENSGQGGVPILVCKIRNTSQPRLFPRGIKFTFGLTYIKF